MLALRYILAVAIRSIFMTVGIPGNILIIVVYCKKRRKTGTDVSILGLAVVDFIVCLSFPLKIYSYLTSQFTNDVLCKLMHFIVFWNTYIGVFLTAIITVDRYIAVCKPLKRRLSAKQAVIIISIFAVIAAFFGAIPSFTMTGIQSYGHVSRCSYVIGDVIFADVIAYLNDTLFYSCLVLITVLYTLIWVAVRRQARVRALKLSGIGSVSAPAPSAPLAMVPTDHRSGMPHEAWAGSETANELVPQRAAQMLNGSAAANTSRASNSNVVPARETSPGIQSSHKSLDPSAPPQQPKQGSPQVITTRSTAPSLKSASSRNNPTIRTNNKTTIMIFITTVIFFLSWIPTKIWDYYPDVKYAWIQTDPVRYNIFFTSLFAVNFNQVVNPFIYSFVSVQFRRECLTVIRQIRQCRS